jgi:alpha-beta hydrolase superfamily lysophospholipase
MPVNKTKLRKTLRWIGWVLLIQFLLLNISASFYAYRFTYFYDGVPPDHPSKNVFAKTWRLFAGPRLYKDTEEGEPRFPYETVSLKTSSGLAISGWYGGLDSSKACVIFLHGYSTNKRSVLAEASEFNAWGYSVLLIDYRGHGKSEGNSTSFGVKETDELEKAVAFARSKGNKNIILYGSSLGAAIAIKAASENKVHPVAIIADMPFQDLHHHLRSRAKLIGFPAEPFGVLVSFWIGVERGYNGFGHDVSSYAKNVHCPVLLQWGDKDIYVERSETEKIFANLASAHKKLVVYPGVNHLSYLGENPDKWEEEVHAFVNSLSF